MAISSRKFDLYVVTLNQPVTSHSVSTFSGPFFQKIVWTNWKLQYVGYVQWL